MHGCTVEDEAFVGMGATLLDGVYVEKHAMVAAGALVRQNTKIPCGEVCINGINEKFYGLKIYKNIKMIKLCNSYGKLLQAICSNETWTHFGESAYLRKDLVMF